MVTDPADYRWSSFPHHGLGRADPLVSGFPEWEELGATEAQRRRRWRARVRGEQYEAELADVATERPAVGDGRLDRSGGQAAEDRLETLPSRTSSQGKTDTNSLTFQACFWSTVRIASVAKATKPAASQSQKQPTIETSLHHWLPALCRRNQALRLRISTRRRGRGTQQREFRSSVRPVWGEPRAAEAYQAYPRKGPALRPYRRGR